MNKLLILVVLLFVLPSVLGAEIFEEWVISGDSFEYEGVTYATSYNEGAKKAFYDSDIRKFVLDVGGCDTESGVNACLNSVDHGSKAKYEGGIEYPALKVYMKKASADLDIQRIVRNSDEIDTDNLNIGDRITYDVTIKNVGELVANNIIYKDEFPQGITVSPGTLTKLPNGVSWTGVISPESSRTFTYSININSYVDFRSTPEASFVSGDERLTDYGDSIDMQVAPPLEINVELDPEFPELNSAFTYKVSMENKAIRGAAEIHKLDIMIPQGIVVNSADSKMEKNGNVYSYTKSIAKDDTEDLEFRLTATKEAELEILLDYDITVENIRFSKKLSETLYFGSTQIIPIIELEDTEFDSGESFAIKARLRNVGKDYLRNIYGQISAPRIGTKQIMGESVDSGKERVVYNRKLIAPNVDKKETITIVFSGSYQDLDGNTEEFKTSKQITVLPQNKALQIDAPEFIQANPGGRAKLDFNVKNLFSKNIKEAELVFIAPKGLEMDEVSIKAEFNSNEQKRFLNFVKVTDGFTDKLAVIKVIANADYEGGFYTEEFNIPIRITDEPITVDEEDVKDEDISFEDGIVDVSNGKPRKGILNIVWDWISGIFS